MPQQIRVQPGDLITADFINSLIARIEALEAAAQQPPPTPTFTLPTLTFPTFPTFTINPTIFPTATFPTFTINPTATFPTLTINPTIFPTLTFNPTFATQPAFTLNPSISAMPTMVFNPSAMPTMVFNPGGGGFNPVLNPGFGIAPVESGAEVTALPGIGTLEKRALGKIDINTVQEFADADVAKVATALKVSEEEAGAMVERAKNSVNR